VIDLQNVVEYQDDAGNPAHHGGQARHRQQPGVEDDQRRHADGAGIYLSVG